MHTRERDASSPRESPRPAAADSAHTPRRTQHTPDTADTAVTLGLPALSGLSCVCTVQMYCTLQRRAVSAGGVSAKLHSLCVAMTCDTARNNQTRFTLTHTSRQGRVLLKTRCLYLSQSAAKTVIL